MQIDRTNYEIYFLDYLEGNLSEHLIDEFLDFLEKNPDLKEELQAVSGSAVKLPAENIPFEAKSQLYRDVLTGATRFEYKAIASLEGDLDETEETAFRKRIQADPQKKKEFELIKRMQIRPETGIVYPDKKKLLKKSGTRKLWIWSGSVAAALILGLVIRGIVVDDPNKSFPGQKHTVISGNLSEAEPVGPQVEEIPTIEPQLPQSQPISPKQAIAVIHKEDKRTEEPAPIISAEEEEVPEALNLIEPKIIVLSTPVTVQIPQQTTGTGYQKEYTSLSGFLAQKLLDAPKGEPFSLATIARAGLEAAETISNKKFSVEKSEEGRIAEIRFNSSLIGFNIPIKKNK